MDPISRTRRPLTNTRPERLSVVAYNASPSSGTAASWNGSSNQPSLIESRADRHRLGNCTGVQPQSPSGIASCMAAIRQNRALASVVTPGEVRSGKGRRRELPSGQRHRATAASNANTRAVARRCEARRRAARSRDGRSVVRYVWLMKLGWKSRGAPHASAARVNFLKRNWYIELLRLNTNRLFFNDVIAMIRAKDVFKRHRVKIWCPKKIFLNSDAVTRRQLWGAFFLEGAFSW